MELHEIIILVISSITLLLVLYLLFRKQENNDALIKGDLDKAITELKTFSNEMKNTAKNMNLGDISGGMSQFTKYVNDLVSLTKQLSKTKDVNLSVFVLSTSKMYEVCLLIGIYAPFNC